MEDMNKLKDMGLIGNEFFDDMRKTIDESDQGGELLAAFNRISELQKKPDTFIAKRDQIKHIRKCEKEPLEKNRKKRKRKQMKTI